MKKADNDTFSSSRLKHEAKTIEVMIRMYCHAHHYSDDLCQHCNSLLLYSRKRLQRCIFQSAKPVCGNCTVHCYKREMKEAICKVMRFAGPRMAYIHPLMAIRHLWDKRRQTPPLPGKGSKTSQPQQKARLNTTTGSKGGK